MDLRKVNFGRDTAEFDTQLKDYFVTTSAYQDVVEGRKSLLIGRKGSGKTSIMKYCIENENKGSQYIIKVEATHATYTKISERLNTLAVSIQNLDSSFKLAWLLTVFMRLVERFIDESVIAVSKEERRIYDFAITSLGYNRADPISLLAGYVFDWFRRLKRVGEIEREVASEALVAFDEVRLIKLISDAVKRANDKGLSVYIFFDKLDERWDGSDLHIAFIQGLLMALKDIKTLSGRVYPVLLLRDDIFRAVVRTFQHVDHYRMEVSTITWDENSLIELIALRIRASTVRGTSRGLVEDSKQLWELVFPEKFKDRKHVSPSYTYMVERTLFRPRDIILFCNMARDRASRNRVEHLGIKELGACEKEYSEIKREDLVAEYSYLYPNLGKFLLRFKKRTNGYELEELRELILELQDGLSAGDEFKEMEFDDIISILYSLGFLCYTRKGGVLRGTRVIHSGVDPDATTILEEKRVFISPIFRKGLDLKDH